MSLFGPRPRQQRVATITAQELVPRRMVNRPGIPPVTNESALRHSAVWASLRLRANLISTMPLNSYRTVDDIQVSVPPAPVLVQPGGSGGSDLIDILEWLYSTQVDLDRGGNVFGIIAERNALGLAARIDLQPLSAVSVIIRKGQLAEIQISGKPYDPRDIWHERQYTVAGLPIGLSPVQYAAWSISEYLSIQDFALDWFGAGGVPAAHLKNTAKTINPNDAAIVKERFKASTQAGDVFVSGADWEYQMIQGEQAASSWLEAKQASVSDIARFFDVPGDLLDAVVQSGNITYANVTQRNMQFLIMHLGPAIRRREKALSGLLPKPRFVEFDRQSLLEMDPLTLASYWNQLITARAITPDEIRAQLNRAPLTAEQIHQLLTFFPPRGSTVEADSGLEAAPLAPMEVEP